MIKYRASQLHTHDTRSAIRVLFLLMGLALAACAPVKPTAPHIDSIAAPAAVSSPQAFAYLKSFSSSNVRDGCPPEGDAKPDSVKALNILKNRVIPPQDDEYDASVTLSAFLKPGDDEDRWDEAKGGVLEGFVHDAKVGGIETANCKATDPADRDTHIELVLSQSKDGPTKRARYAQAEWIAACCSGRANQGRGTCAERDLPRRQITGFSGEARKRKPEKFCPQHFAPLSMIRPSPGCPLRYAFLLRSSPGRTSMYARATHVSHPWPPVECMRSTQGWIYGVPDGKQRSTPLRLSGHQSLVLILPHAASGRFVPHISTAGARIWPPTDESA